MIRREGDRLLIQSLDTRYWMRVDRWQKWFEETEAVTAMVK
jgi:hypothetical protein